MGFFLIFWFFYLSLKVFFFKFAISLSILSIGSTGTWTLKGKYNKLPGCKDRDKTVSGSYSGTKEIK
jgi:hypothetical protein